MRTQIVTWTLFCLCAAPPALRAQEFRLWNRNVQVHGFASQGFVFTDQNNWLTMKTSQGSAAFTDFGANISAEISDKFCFGAQFYATLGKSEIGGPNWTGRTGTTVQELAWDSRRQGQNHTRLVQQHARYGCSANPETLVRLQIGGTVRLIVTISPKGNVDGVQRLGGNPILAESAIRAVKQWLYAPSPSRTISEVSIPFVPKN